MKNNSKIFLTLIAAGLAAAGCRSAPTRHEYFLIRPADDVLPAVATSPLSLRLRPVRAPGRYRERIVYRRDDQRMGFYEYSLWMEPPAEMIAGILEDALRRRAFFARVAADVLPPATDYLLETSIISFDQIVEDERLLAECRLAFELIRKSDRLAVWSGRTEARVAHREGRFAEAMNEAANRAVAEAIREMEEALAAEADSAG